MKALFLFVALIGSYANAYTSTYNCASATDSNFKYQVAFDEGFMLLKKLKFETDYNSRTDVIFEMEKLWNEPSPKCYEIGRRDINNQLGTDVSTIGTFCQHENQNILTITTRNKPLPWVAQDYLCEAVSPALQ